MSTHLLEALEYMHAQVHHGRSLARAVRNASRMYHIRARTLAQYWRAEP